MLSLKLRGLWRAVCPALTVAAALVALSPEARALPLPTGLEGGCTISGCAGAQYWDPDAGGNGHYYAFVASADESWADANTAASGSSIGGGSHGYLATITDPEENAFIVGSILPAGFTHKRQVWLGGVQGAGAKSPASDWHWINPEINPEVWDYTDWTPGEPNDENAAHTGHEDHLTMWVHYYVAQAGAIALDMRGMWNDEDATSQSTSPIVGYIVEWEGGGVPVPEPSAALLGLLGVGLVAKRFRR
jgi:hypothetical protein